MFPLNTDVTCTNVMVVITDGKDVDPGHFMSVCHSDDGDGGGGYYGCDLITLNSHRVWNIVDSTHRLVSE